VDRRSRTRKVIDLIDLEKDRLGDIVPYQLEPMIVQQIRDILFTARKEIIKANDIVAVGQKPLAKVRANKTGAAGDKNSHIILMAKKSGAPTASLSPMSKGEATLDQR